MDNTPVPPDPLAPKPKSRQPTGARVPPTVRKKIWKLFLDGFSYAAIAKTVGYDHRQVAAICKGYQSSDGSQWAVAREVEDQPSPRLHRELGPEALRALEDFGYFRARYFGRRSTPWQEDAAHRVQGLLATPEKEFAVVNVAPASGKSTLFTHDVPAWLACRSRRIRGLIGSRTFRQARWYTGRLRRTFERYEVLPPDDEEVAAGRALVPQASLVGDFGRFRPLTRFGTDVWRADEFVIAQPGDILISEKEASFAAYGLDSGYLGGRFPFVIWDDLVDRKNIRNAEVLQQLIEQYEDVAETRLNMGGLLLLQGQRLGANDLYRHALDQRAGFIDDDEDDGEDLRPDKYHHIVYKAHYEELCRGKETHHRDAPAYRPPPTPEGEVLRGLFAYTPPPSGCLLDPRRITWRELRQIRANRREKFEVLYQQEDVDPKAVLVPKIWVDGGTDPESGERFAGCWDDGRAAWELPRDLVAPTHVFATVDPSPTMFWSCQVWAWNAPTEQMFLLDLVRRKMDAPEFLDWNPQTGMFSGLAEEWQQRSRDAGLPITHWIVEANAAQRFLLQYEFVRQWQRTNRTIVVPHQTQRNKTDPEFGVQSIAPLWRHGLVRLPTGKSLRGELARLSSLALVDEVTRYPDGTSDDCVMAMWMGVYNLQRIFRRQARKPRRTHRPSWLKVSA